MPPQPFVGSEFPEADFGEVCRLLLAKRGVDLRAYKDQCIKRRIAARVRHLGFGAAGPYLEVLRQDEGEVDRLLAAVTINVSQFFRNPSTFAFLEERVLPELVRRAEAAGSGSVRLWSAGCAGGEEPYSLALLAQRQPGMAVSILATDISPAVLARARLGVFPVQRLAEVSAPVLQRCFVPRGADWQLLPDLRDRVEFRLHNLLTPTPFPASDLILCRNVLIYFSRAEQDQILERFAAALEPGGILVLGQAETLLGGARRFFEQLSAEERTYRRC